MDTADALNPTKVSQIYLTLIASTLQNNPEF